MLPKSAMANTLLSISYTTRFIFYSLLDPSEKNRRRFINRQLEADLELLGAVSVQSHTFRLSKRGIDFPVDFVSTFTDQTTKVTDYSRGYASYLMLHLVNWLIIWM